MSSEIQAILFDKNKWTTTKARKWLKKQNIKPIKRTHRTKNFLRYRIKNPRKYKRLRTKSIKSYGLKFIIGWK